MRAQREQKLGQFLVQKGLLDNMQLASAVASAEQWGQRLTESVMHLRLMHEGALVAALSELSRVPHVDLAKQSPEPAALEMLDAEFCKQHGLLPFALTEEGKVLHLAMADPLDLTVLDEITRRRRVRIKAYVVGELILQKAIQRFYLGMERVSLEPTVEEAPVAEMDEIKLVDASGKTLMLTNAVASLKQMMLTAPVQVAAPPAPTAKPPVQVIAAPPPPTAKPPAQVIAAPPPPTAKPPAPAAVPPPLLGGTSQLPPASPESAVEARLTARIQELEKLVAAHKQSQVYAERVLRSLLDCLLVGGAVKPEDLRARMSQYPRSGAKD